MCPSMQMFSSSVFYVFCLKSAQLKSVPQESIKEDGQKSVLFLFSQYPLLLLQNIHSTSVGMCSSFIQEEVKLQF